MGTRHRKWNKSSFANSSFNLLLCKTRQTYLRLGAKTPELQVRTCFGMRRAWTAGHGWEKTSWLPTLQGPCVCRRATATKRCRKQESWSSLKAKEIPKKNQKFQEKPNSKIPRKTKFQKVLFGPVTGHSWMWNAHREVPLCCSWAHVLQCYQLLDKSSS